MDGNQNFVSPILKEKLERNLTAMRKLCEQEIKNRVQSVEKILMECQERLLAELDKTLREMAQAEESNLVELREISFRSTDLSSINNILGFLAVEGLLPSNLHLILSSPLKDLKPGSPLMFSVEAVADTEVTLKPGWDKKLSVQVSFLDSDGQEKLLRMKKKTEGTKRMLRFDTTEAGIYQVTATLYDHHIQNSPFLVPVGPDLLADLGIDHMDNRALGDSMITPAGSAGVKMETSAGIAVQPPASPSSSFSTPSTLVSNNTSTTSTVQEEPEQKAQVDGQVDGEPFPEGSKVRFSQGNSEIGGIVMRKPSSRLYIVEKENEGGLLGLRPEEMTLVEGWTVGQDCIAMWTEDQVHYNAKIVATLPDGNYRVLFVDYGNEADVSPDNIFTSSEQISAGGYIDQFVRQTEVAPQPAEVQEDPAPAQKETELDSEDWGGSSDPVFFTAPLPSTGIVQSERLEFPSLLSRELTSVGIIDVGSPVSSMALLGHVTEVLLCLTQDPRLVQVFSSITGDRLGSLEHEFLVLPEAILVRQEGGVVISDSNPGGVHLFTSNLEYVEFIPIPDSESITSMTEGKDASIISLNQSDIDGIYSLTTAIFGNSSEKKDLTDLIDMAQCHRATENPNGAPRSDCRFITTKLDKTYIADSGLNCIYIISGDEAIMIPDTFDNTAGVEFGDLKSLVCDDLGNMIVIDSASDKLQVIDIHGKLLGCMKVDHPPARPTSICVDQGRRELFVAYSEANTVYKYQL